jgi:hypothetical protein
MEVSGYISTLAGSTPTEKSSFDKTECSMAVLNGGDNE